MINLDSDDDDALTSTASENENEICHTEICLAMKRNCEINKKKTRQIRNNMKNTLKLECN